MDKIPKFDGFPDSFILNLDPHDLPGSHWIAVFINHEKIGEFFDSYGNKPKDELLSNYLTKNCQDWEHNEKSLQSPYSSVCGQYCLYFLCHKVRGETMKDILRNFGDDSEENDILVSNWVNETFDLNTDVYDLEFMFNQICRAMLSK